MKLKIIGFIKSVLERFIPKEHHLKDTILHNILGEKLFDPKLWTPTKHSVTLAVLLGTFVAFTPTIGGQMIIAGVLAFVLRVNIPISLLFVWISNPVTAPFIYSFEYEVGKFVLGIEHGPKIIGIKSFFENFSEIAKPLGVGSLIVSIVMGIVAYLLVFVFWKFIKKLKPYLHVPHIIKKE